MPNIVIDIAAEFTGGNAFKKAETSTDRLEKGAKKLGKTLLAVYSTQKLLAYGKASVQAAAADEKAQNQLALALKNVGLGRDAANTEEFIQRLQREFGVVDDKLRPAYQTLAVATRNSAEAQKLLQVSLDISASTGKDLGAVTSALSKAYLGNNTALSKLGVGISKADLKTKSFDEIITQITETFAGSALQATKGYSGQMDRLTVASNNAKEIIGKGLLDALTNLSDDGSIDSAATSMENFATNIAYATVGLSELIKGIKGLPGLQFVKDLIVNTSLLKPNGWGVLTILGKKKAQVEASQQNNKQGLAHLAELEAAYTKENLGYAKKLTAEQIKQLNAKKLQMAIDKANLALGKGNNIFDMEKIQLAAAEKNQAEQLGKITSQAQLLQITNDTARLRVKQDILALEEAIQSKDVAAITAATNKLNADLQIVGALTGQELKLRDIEDILKSIVPKDLINIANLDEAIGKLKAIATGFGTTPSSAGSTFGAGSNVTSIITAASVAAAIAGRAGTDISGATDPRVAYGGQRIDSAGNYNSYNAEMAYAMSSAGRNAATGGNVNITVQAGVGDPNAIAEAVDKVLRDAVDRGTLRSLATA
jgi:hypothetical protein